MIARHRIAVEKGGAGYSETVTFGGFGPTIPYRINAQEAADMEAAWLGEVMMSAVKAGAVPPVKMPMFNDHPTDKAHTSWWGRSFWWVNGQCRGLAGGLGEAKDYGFFGQVSSGWGDDIRLICSTLRTWAPSVLRIEGVGEVLARAEKIRRYSVRVFPNEAERWLSVDEAAERFGRSRRTIRNWVDAGTVEHIGSGYSAMIAESAIRFRVDAIKSSVDSNAERTNIIRRSERFRGGVV